MLHYIVVAYAYAGMIIWHNSRIIPLSFSMKLTAFSYTSVLEHLSSALHRANFEARITETRTKRNSSCEKYNKIRNSVVNNIYRQGDNV